MTATTTAPAVTATYRLQLHAGFTFADAEAVLPYLADLGVSHLYLSPVLVSTPGSLHGYDVLDHTRVDPELGGREGLERLARAAHDRGLGVVVDIVPNHMALVPPQWTNAPLWTVLRDGQRASTAHWFDVDWAALGGRFGLPVLGDTLRQSLDAGELRLDTGRPDEGPAAGEPVIRYHEHVLPVAPGTAHEGDDVATVLERQHYLLAGWREADEVLNYRRFFEVDQLIGVRVEEADVFAATHRLLLDLHHAGVVDHVRIDHPDGLHDPEGYLAELARHCRPGTLVWVEKILEGSERLPSGWACAGTTGYDAAAALGAALVPPSTVDEVSAAWAVAGGEPDLHAVVDACKRLAVAELLGPEVGRLLRRAREALPREDPDDLRAALTELLVAVDAYRAYVRPGTAQEQAAVQPLQDGIELARSRRPDLAETVDALGGLLLHPAGAGADPGATVDLAVRFQQVTGPVMAKGIEDTAFYRWHRLVALNEVGFDPSAALDPGTQPLHAWARHQAEHWPQGMTTASTHDTKRSEAARARVLAVAGDAGAWRACTEAYAAAARDHDVDGPTAHLLWQTLVAVGPDVDDERLEAYLTKALREGKEHTSWVTVDEGYERRVRDLAARARTPGPLRETVETALAGATGAVRALTLTHKALQLTLPGVPDTYQGTELAELSLVDPDNRRPVDFADRQERLTRLDAGGEPRDLDDELLLVTSTVLRLRRERPEAFAGDHRPLDTGDRVVGYLRGGEVAVLAVRDPWAAPGEERAALPAGRWTEVLTGAVHEGGADGIPLASLLGQLPVAVLARA